MSTLTKDYASINVGQLKQLIEDIDDDREIRIWVEKEVNEQIVLEGRRLIGVMDDPNDKYACLVAGYYKNEEQEWLF